MGKQNKAKRLYNRTPALRDLLAAWKENGRPCPKCGEAMQERPGQGPKQPLFKCEPCGKFYGCDEIVRMFRPNLGLFEKIEESKKWP